jgi:hypothetical protein
VGLVQPDSVKDGLGLLALQLLAATLALIPAYFIGSCAAWVPAVGTLAGALLWFFVRNPGADRTRVRQMALISGAGHAVVGCSAYFAAWWCWPATFDLSAQAMFMVAPVLGAGVGVAALALTLAAGDAAGTSRGTL